MFDVYYDFFLFLYSLLLFLSLRLLSPGISAYVREIDFSLHPSITALSIFPSGSPCVAFAVVLPSCGFHLRVIFLPTWSTPTSVPDHIFDSRWSVFASSSFVVLSLLLVTPFFFSFLFHPSLPFFRVFHFLSQQFSVYPSSVLPNCMSLHMALLFSSLSPRLLLLQGFAALLAIRLLRSSSRWVFCPLPASSSVFRLRVLMVFSCWFIHSFQLPLLQFMGLLLLLSFICFSLASALSCLVWFILLSSVHLLSASLPFPGLCAFLSHSLPVCPASLSFFHGGCLVHVLAFDPFFLYSLFVLVSSVSSVLFFFSVLSRLYNSFVLCLSSLLCSPFQSSSSTPLLRPPLGFPVLSLLLCSPERLYSSSWFFPLVVMGFGFCSLACCGSYGSGCYSTFVLSFAATLLCSSVRLLRLLLSSLLFRIPHSRLLLPVFLYVFPWADAPAAPSRLPPCFYACYGSGCSSRSSSTFPRAAAASAPCALWCGSCCLACCGFCGCVSSPFLFCTSRRFSSFFVSGLSQVSSFLHRFVSSGCLFSLFVPSSSSFVGDFLHSGFGASSAGVTFLFLSVPTAFCGDSDSFGSPVPFGTCQVLLRPLFLSLVRVASGGLFPF